MSESNHRVNEAPDTENQDQSDRLPAAEGRADEVKVTEKDGSGADADVQAHRELDKAADKESG